MKKEAEVEALASLQGTWAASSHDRFSRTAEEILASFPRQHSCQCCKEEIINAFNANSASNLALLRLYHDAFEAARSGCQLYEWLLEFYFRSGAPSNIGFYMQKTSLKTLHDINFVRFLIGTRNYTWPCAEFEVFTEPDNAAASYISTRPFNSDVASLASCNIAKSWLRECHQDHEECRADVLASPPTRLVQLNNDDMGCVKIVTLNRPVKYATLSYCWGGDQVIKSTTSTIFQYQICIEVSSLGQTLQDAVKVARSLDIPYLWVDSLCIVQDDPDEVAKEIAKMAEYYQGGHVSICASVASRSGQGFLAPRTSNPYLYGPFELPYCSPNGKLGSVKLAQYHKHSRELEPVNARGWIMQESLLATRLLSYSYRSVAWSCRKTNRSDGGPVGEWYDFGDRRMWAKLQEEKCTRTLLKGWIAMVESFTSRTLSNADDRLPAISGIAQEFAKLLGGSMLHHLHHGFGKLLEGERIDCVRYVAGLWYCRAHTHPKLKPDMFCEQLLWSTSYYKAVPYLQTPRVGKLILAAVGLTLPSSSSPTASGQATETIPFQTTWGRRAYRYPSWSWASVEMPVSFEYNAGKNAPGCRISIVDCETRPKRYKAPYGNVGPGKLTVKGLLIPVPTGLIAFPGKINSRWRIVHRPDTEESTLELSEIVHGSKKGWILLISGVGDLTFNKSHNMNWTESAAKGLVLVKYGSQFRRIGLCSIKPGNNLKAWTEELTEYGEEKQIIIV